MKPQHSKCRFNPNEDARERIVAAMKRLNLLWLLPPLMPFLILLLIRLLWFVSGASWSDPELAAILSLITSAPLLVPIAIAILVEDKSLTWDDLFGDQSE